MSRPTWLYPVLLLAGATGAAPGAPGRPVFAYASDSLRATLTLIGGRGSESLGKPDPGSPPGWRIACAFTPDSAAPGPMAWYEVELIEKRQAGELRFPVDAAALRKGLAEACAHTEGDPAARIAAGLRTLAASLHVKVEGRSGGPGE